MKKAIGILNRNMPELADDLVEIVKDLDADIFVLENGSDPDKYSKHANLFETESNGIAYGLNALMQYGYDKRYDYLWVNYNDARLDDPEGFFNWSVSQMENDKRIGVSAMHWGSMWDIHGRKKPAGWWDPKSSDIDRKLVTFFDDLSFVVSRRALDTIMASDSRLTPFFDSTNYTNHYNLLAPSLALYSSGMYMITNPKYTGVEVRDPAESNSEAARGFDDSYWKEVKGPSDAEKWINSFFSEFSSIDLPAKNKRDIVINSICKAYRKNKENRD